MTETRFCSICHIEFEPKTVSIPVVDGRVHYGCYAKFTRGIRNGS